MEANESLAYIAGFVDGEGSIGIHKSQGLYATLWLQVSNADERVIQYISHLLPGRIYATRRTRNGKVCKISYKIQWNSQEAIDVLELILPYLIVKKDMAEVALEFWYKCYTNNQGRIISEAEVILRKSYKDRISELNHEVGGY